MDRSRWVQTYLKQNAEALKQRAAQLWSNPHKYAWWCDQIAPLRHLPRPIALAPLWLRLRLRAKLDELEAAHPRPMFWIYAGLDVATRIALVWLGSGIVNDGLRALSVVTPTSLAGRIAPVVDWATSSYGLTALTMHALWMRAVVEVVTLLDSQQGDESWVDRSLDQSAQGLELVVKELPTLVADASLLAAFMRLGLWGRALAISRVGYRFLPPLITWAFGRSIDLRASHVRCESQNIHLWHKLRRQELCVELNPESTWDQWLEPLVEMVGRQASPSHGMDPDQKEDFLLANPVKREAQRVIDRYTIIQLAKSPDNVSERWSRLSLDTRRLLSALEPSAFDGLDPTQLGVYVARHESSHSLIAAGLRRSVLANPAHEYLYLREKGGWLMNLFALQTLPLVVFSLWTARAEPFPWGKLGDREGTADSEIYLRAFDRVQQSGLCL